MNKLDLQYQNLLKDILENGIKKQDRTGTGTISVFGRQLRHDFRDGFPLLTTKRMAFKQIVTELLWFLRGDTNIKYLVDNNCHIWDGDAYKRYSVIAGMSTQVQTLTQEDFINKIKTDRMFAFEWGELGPIYGAQWRRWFPGGKDQIKNLINDLKTNPDSRRLMVNAWNVGELDSMVLPPCHYGFQVYTRELSFDERLKLANIEKPNSDNMMVFLDYVSVMDNRNIPTRAISLMWNQRSVDTFLGLPFNIASYGLLLEIIAKTVNMIPDELIGNLGDVHLYSNHIEQAKEQIGREYTQEEIQQHLQESGMDAMMDEARMKYISKLPKRTREPYPLPTLKINSGNENWHLLDIDEIINSLDVDLTFKLENYQSHPKISAPLSN